MAINDLGAHIAGGLQATAVGAALGITVGTAPIPDAAGDLARDGTPLATMVDFSADSREGAEALAQAFRDGEVDEQIDDTDYGDHSDPDQDPIEDFVGEIDTWDTTEADYDEAEDISGDDVSGDDVP